MVNLEAVGVLNPEEDGSLSLSPSLTRAQAAKCFSALEVLDFRDRIW
ncbi:MAG: hypothetical protein ACLR1T_01885 [Evtepia gabavorous]